MRKGIFLFVLAAAGLVFGQEPVATAQTTDDLPTFRTGVSSVRVDVQVMEGSRVLTGLTKEDFLLYDNNAPKVISSLDQEREPVTLLMVLDVSGSMAKFVQQLATASREALQSLRPGDQVGLMVFARDSKVTLPFTSELENVPEKLRAAIREEDLGNGTQINQALIDAAKFMSENAPPKGRRAVLIVTDNESVNYQSPDSLVVQEMNKANAVVNAIVVGKGRRPGTESRFKNPDFTIANVYVIADDTGGDVMKSDKAGEAFAVILDRIRSRYSLYFGAPEDGKSGQFRTIRVELKGAAAQAHKTAVLRYRKGYYVP